MAPTKKEVAKFSFAKNGMCELYTCKLYKKQKKQSHKSGYQDLYIHVTTVHKNFERIISENEIVLSAFCLCEKGSKIYAWFE